MELTYHRERDYLYPDLVLEPEKPIVLGKYGMLRKRYLKEHRAGMYAALLLEGKLNRHLAEIEEEAAELFDRLTSQMASPEGLTETLKPKNQMEWVRRMSSIWQKADEMVLYDLIYENDHIGRRQGSR